MFIYAVNFLMWGLMETDLFCSQSQVAIQQTAVLALWLWLHFTAMEVAAQEQKRRQTVCDWLVSGAFSW